MNGKETHRFKISETTDGFSFRDDSIRFLQDRTF